jgi:N utilization substance protein B
MATSSSHPKTLSYARHIGRELAFLTVSSLTQQYHREETDRVNLEELLERAVRVLLSEAEAQLKDTGIALEQVYSTLSSLEPDEASLTSGDLQKLLKQKLKELNDLRLALLDQTHQMEHACHLMEESIQLPLLRILADTPQIREFALILVENYREHQHEIEGEVNRVSTEWPLERMNSIERDIIRIAAAELFYDPFANSGDSTPLPVVINEAVELTKKYSSGDSHRFVNGVLHNILPKAEQLRRSPA